MTLQIGIAGPKRHGKDTLGQMFIELQPELERFAFADKMKELLIKCMRVEDNVEANKEGLQIFSTSESLIRDAIKSSLKDALDSLGFTVDYATESLMYVLRTQFNASVDPYTDAMTFEASWRTLLQQMGTTWGRDCLDEDIWVFYTPDINFVSTDVRRDNEAQAIIDKGGIIVHVHDPRKEVNDGHISEAGISDDLITTYFNNDSTLDKLKEDAKSFLETYKETL